MKQILTDRNKDLRAAYDKIRKVLDLSFLDPETLCHIMASLPAPRFYIDSATARLYLNGVRRPKTSVTQALVEDLKENFQRLRQKYSGETPNCELHELLVEQPAKHFYLTHRTILCVVKHYAYYRD